MTDVTVSVSTAVVVATSPTSATVTAVGAAEATVYTERATITSALQQVDTIGDPSWIQFNTTAVPTPGVGRLHWNDTDGTLEFQMKGGLVTQQIGMEQFIHVKSSNNTERAEGKVVYATGSDGVNILVAYAQASSESASSRTLAVMTETITGGNKGYATTFGLVRGLNTSALTEGAAIWLSPTVPGGLTTTKPSAPDHLVFIGYCLRRNQNNGVIFVSIQNGYELDELHNVKITNPQNGDVLRYNSATGIWQNGQP